MKRQRAAPYSNRPFKKPRKSSQKSLGIRTNRAVIQPERKYFDAELNNTVIPTSTSTWAGAELDPTTLNTLFAPVRGDDIADRTGRKVQVLSIKIRGFVNVVAQTNATDADNAFVGRLVLVQDKQSNAAQLNAEDVIQSGAGTVATMMFQSSAFFGRFNVLKDKVFKFQSPTLTYDGTNIEQSGLIMPFKINHKFTKPVTVSFNTGNAGTIADCVDNSFHLIGLTNNATLANTVNYKVRTAFIDV